MANVTKQELVEAIAHQTGITQVDSKIVLESFFETICYSLQQGRNVEIRGFGRFKVKRQKARLARNPKTGEKIHVKAGFKPVFEASRELKKKMNREME